MTDPLERMRIRVEVARMVGDMPDYVEDVEFLLGVVDAYRHQGDHINEAMDAANLLVARLKAQAAMTDTAESTKHDRELMYRGASEVVQILNGGL